MDPAKEGMGHESQRALIAQFGRDVRRIVTQARFSKHRIIEQIGYRDTEFHDVFFSHPDDTSDFPNRRIVLTAIRSGNLAHVQKTFDLAMLPPDIRLPIQIVHRSNEWGDREQSPTIATSYPPPHDHLPEYCHGLDGRIYQLSNRYVITGDDRGFRINTYYPKYQSKDAAEFFETAAKNNVTVLRIPFTPKPQDTNAVEFTPEDIEIVRSYLEQVQNPEEWKVDFLGTGPQQSKSSDTI